MLRIYNTLTREKQVFQPIEPGKIGMYVCGITVYDYCHIGHARVMVAFDMITRYLRARGWEVNYIRNITDVDDKIFNRANENQEPYTQLTERFIQAMHDDEDALGVLRPNAEPRATAYMEDIIAMVQTLLEKGYAYQGASGDVFYRLSKFKNYGLLTNKNLDEMLVGARVEQDHNKENPLDFVLWKSAKAGEASWDSPWGKGRPGWHIECSAMSTQCLGNHFDIHGGGPDLPFPHHENEIAQSEAATGETYVNTWMHAGAVRVNEEKMSKSLGNFFTIREVLKSYHPEVIRYFLLSSHYRSPINYSEESLHTSRGALMRFYTALRDAPEASTRLVSSEFTERFNTAMDDDFNTPEALAVMFELVKAINKTREQDIGAAALLVTELKALGAILGLLGEDPEVFIQGGDQDSDENFRRQVDDLIVQRKTARANKDWPAADAVRDALNKLNVVVEDRPDGSTIWRIE
ncbi:MAG TPA: cysteine--tRNA ligase [Pseudomonadales bacterium]